MSNLILVIFVFLIGFGWGAAAMYIHTYKKMQDMVAFGLSTLEILKEVAAEQAKVNDALNNVRKSCISVIDSTGSVIDSVDKLIEEIGNEI